MSDISAVEFSNNATECKPAILAPCITAIPPVLRKEPKRWAPWAAVWNPKRRKYDKVPRRVKNVRAGVSTDDAWWNFADAVAAYEVLQFAEDGGLGFRMTRIEELVGIDLDRCVDTNGNIDAWASEIVERAGSYAERSPSGNGLRIFVTGHVARDWCDNVRGIEVYGGHSGRFLTVTGLRLPASTEDVQPAPGGFLEWLVQAYPPVQVASKPGKTIEIPDLVPHETLPQLSTLVLPDRVRAFLTEGDTSETGDRSHTLAYAALKLYEATAAEDGSLRDEVVLSLLWSNDHARTVALDHRRDDEDRALEYLWVHHCLAQRGKAFPAAAAFDVVETSSDAPDPLPAFKRNKAGEVLPSKENITMALRRPDLCGWQLRHDVFRDEIMLASPGADDWRPFKDTDYTALCIRLERGQQGFKDIARERIRETVAYVAEAAPFDSASHWLSLQRWDGTHRVERFLIDYFGAEDTPYTRAVGLYFWTAIAGRVLQPGIKADMVPVAVGAQGTMKSSTVAAIVPAPDFFLELDLSSKDDDQARLMRGKLVIELGELKGLRAREMEQVKAFITRTHENWVPKFREMAVSYARRGMFFGTTNKDEFLADETGHRRWLPFKAGVCNPDAVIRDREQLWAEARDLFNTSGVQWQAAEELARAEHAQFVVRDAWEEIVEKWLTEEPMEGGRSSDNPITAVDALRGAIGMRGENITQGVKDRMARVLKELGFVQIRAYVDGKRVRAYVRADGQDSRDSDGTALRD
ncbi:hypothetical protein R20233_02360 [Ralstonia sp. LMG 32965]|uniref:VapE domain-containing protein n=1 Tax=Ralstonia flatus TaxID=3058601 RepID=UPI0028F56E08|nr:VapE domain-containing protein [Ralstonia sp. LMG 32965]CAJ0877806.1 hypothetical protein R20233_02360 [Ralstonia sp. LMG 32965]